MFHDKLKLPNSINPVQIRPADARGLSESCKVSLALLVCNLLIFMESPSQALTLQQQKIGFITCLYV